MKGTVAPLLPQPVPGMLAVMVTAGSLSLPSTRLCAYSFCTCWPAEPVRATKYSVPVAMSTAGVERMPTQVEMSRYGLQVPGDSERAGPTGAP